MSLLFKYREWGNKYHRLSLTHNEIYFAQPDSFNDPFDCQIPIDLDWSTLGAWPVADRPDDSDDVKEIRARFREQISAMSQKGGGPLLLDDIESFEDLLKKRSFRVREQFLPAFEHIGVRLPLLERVDDEVLNALKDEMCADISKMFLQNLLAATGILCFSRTVTDLTMWSHYANHHKGFCVIYEYDQLLELFRHQRSDQIIALPVTYQAPYPKPSTSSMTIDQAVTAVLTTKSKDWEKELEWRCIMFGCKSRVMRVTPECIKGAILGCRISQEDRNAIVEVMRKMKNVSVFQAKLSSDKYELEFDPIPLQ